MDRRAKKLEKKRKSREQAKKKDKAVVARKARELAILVASAGEAEFGPCWISAGWDDPSSPALVTLVVTRKLASGHFLPSVALVDRTCLGIKNAFGRPPVFADEFEELIDEMKESIELVSVEPRIAQSVVFHAIDYARSLGFEPHPDFPAARFGPRPNELEATPWHAAARPIYIAGPHDNVAAIQRKLAHAVGPDGYDLVAHGLGLDDEDDFDEDDEEFDADEDSPLVYSPLGRTIEQAGITLRLLIYRRSDETTWVLEAENHLGGSSVWDERFESDEDALQSALQAIEKDGIESFLPEPAKTPAAAG